MGLQLAFGPDKGGIIGGLDWIGLRGVGAEPNADYAATIPHQAFMVFQMMFAIITPALITGAFAERKKFSAFLALHRCCGPRSSTTRSRTGCGATAAGSRKLGALDFAGGTVVHITSGVSALVARARASASARATGTSRCRRTTCR